MSVRLPPATWWEGDTTVRVNYSEAPTDVAHHHQVLAGGTAPTRSMRVAHLLRGGRPLCRRVHPDDVSWSPATGSSRLCWHCRAVPDGHATHFDITSAAGITHRQLHHWIRCGWVFPDQSRPGSGTRMTFSPAEFDVVVRAGVLARAGLAPQSALRVARGGELATGVRIVFDDEAVAAA